MSDWCFCGPDEDPAVGCPVHHLPQRSNDGLPCGWCVTGVDCPRHPRTGNEEVCPDSAGPAEGFDLSVSWDQFDAAVHRGDRSAVLIQGWNMKLYVVRKGRGYWESWGVPFGKAGEARDWWTKHLVAAAQFTSKRKAKQLAKRTGGEILELVPTGEP